MNILDAIWCAFAILLLSGVGIEIAYRLNFHRLNAKLAQMVDALDKLQSLHDRLRSWSTMAESDRRDLELEILQHIEYMEKLFCWEGGNVMGFLRYLLNLDWFKNK